MKLTFRLTKDNGKITREHFAYLENPDPHPVVVNRMARTWALNQINGPWDQLTVEDETSKIREVEQIPVSVVG